MDEEWQADIAVSLIGIILLNKDDEGVLALAGDLAAAMRNACGRDFVDWEDISAICDRREWALSQGLDNDGIKASYFATILNKIQAHCGMKSTQRIAYILKKEINEKR